MGGNSYESGPRGGSLFWRFCVKSFIRRSWPGEVEDNVHVTRNDQGQVSALHPPRPNGIQFLLEFFERIRYNQNTIFDENYGAETLKSYAFMMKKDILCLIQKRQFLIMKGSFVISN